MGGCASFLRALGVSQILVFAELGRLRESLTKLQEERAQDLTAILEFSAKQKLQAQELQHKSELDELRSKLASLQMEERKRALSGSGSGSVQPVRKRATSGVSSFGPPTSSADLHRALGSGFADFCMNVGLGDLADGSAAGSVRVYGSVTQVWKDFGAVRFKVRWDIRVPEPPVTASGDSVESNPAAIGREWWTSSVPHSSTLADLPILAVKKSGAVIDFWYM
jgi:hypothetical protein